MPPTQPAPTPTHWEAVAEHWRATLPQATWRRHADDLNLRLVEAHVPAGAGAVLKTDAFDEAVGTGLGPALLARAARVTVVDVAATTVERATRRHPGLEGVVADVRRLPFADGAFDVVVSNSTLDHFADRTQILRALAELHRVLRPGGTLVVSLDNRASPVVLARGLLPARVVYDTGLVPYYVGATAGPWALRRLLGAAGFDVAARGALMHCPRVVAVAACDALDRRRAGGRAAEALLRVLRAFEALEALPTRWWTGHFVWAAATRR